MSECYLDWFKKRMPLLEQKGVVSLLCSSVSTPMNLLNRHLSEQEDLLNRRIETPNPDGLPVLLESVAELYHVPEKNILLTQAATNAIFLLNMALVGRGQNVIVENPAYQPLWQTPELIGADVRFVTRQEPHFGIDFQMLESSLTKKTKLVWLTNTHNPSGHLMTAEELIDLSERVHHINPETHIVIDEVYLDMVPGRPKPAFLLYDNLITISSLTKVYGLGHLRCGWIFAKEKILQQIKPIQILVDGIGSAYLESVASIAMDFLPEYHMRAMNLVSENRNILRSYIEPLLEKKLLSGSIPDSGCICFLKIPSCTDSCSIVDRLEKELNLFVTPGVFFGKPDYIRLGYGGSPDVLREGLERFQYGLTKTCS